MPKHPSSGSKTRQDPMANYLAQGLAAHQRGQVEEAARLYAFILGKNPKHAGALHFSGVIKLQSGDVAAGIDLIGRAIRIQPDPTMRCNLANGLIKLRRYPEALEQLQLSVAQDPRNAATHTNLGLVLANLQRPAEAILAHKKALALQPDFPEALNNLGNAQRALRQYEEALVSYDRALRLNPRHIAALNNRGLALAALQRLDEAIASYDAALALRANYPEALNNKGTTLKEKNDFAAALACYDKALALRPDYIEALYNRANALGAANQQAEALQAYRSLLEQQLEHAEAHWNATLTELLLGHFAAGWAGYHWRWKMPLAEAPRHTDRPKWSGTETLQGRSILLWAEQGLGDTIQFCRLALLLAERGTQVWLEVQAPLVGLLQRGLGPQVKVFARGEAVPTTDFHCPLLDLPGALRIDLASIPAPKNYLHADAGLGADWRNRLGHAQRKIGIVCSGNPNLANDRRRSIPLQNFGALATDNTRLFLLQKECRPADSKWMTENSVIQNLGSQLRDFEDTAAIIEQLDLVISVDTSVAHLAGALGKPVWILLPYVPDWRWLCERSDSPWYPSARLFRQAMSGDWSEVFAQLQQALTR
jgi:tetratricopeptide (TPR) repeat protein